MKKYVYLEKKDGVLIAHHMSATNRLEVKERTGTCIDNIYSVDLLVKVNNWLGKTLVFSDKFEVYIKYNNGCVHYFESFAEFRNIVSEYRER